MLVCLFCLLLCCLACFLVRLLSCLFLVPLARSSVVCPAHGLPVLPVSQPLLLSCLFLCCPCCFLLVALSVPLFCLFPARALPFACCLACSCACLARSLLACPSFCVMCPDGDPGGRCPHGAESAKDCTSSIFGRCTRPGRPSNFLVLGPATSRPKTPPGVGPGAVQKLPPRATPKPTPIFPPILLPKTTPQTLANF